MTGAQRILNRRSPLVKLGDVRQLLPVLLQQNPLRTLCRRRGRRVSKPEPQGPVVGDAEVAVGPVGDVFHQPVHAQDAEVVDVQGRPWAGREEGRVGGGS